MPSPTRYAPENQGSGHYEEAEPYNSAALVLLTSPIEGSANEEKGDGNTGSNVERIDPLHAAQGYTARAYRAISRTVKINSQDAQRGVIRGSRQDQSQINGLVQPRSETPRASALRAL
jgi:hypothetical protein